MVEPVPEIGIMLPPLVPPRPKAKPRTRHNPRHPHLSKGPELAKRVPALESINRIRSAHLSQESIIGTGASSSASGIIPIPDGALVADDAGDFADSVPGSIPFFSCTASPATSAAAVLGILLTLTLRTRMHLTCRLTLTLAHPCDCGLVSFVGCTCGCFLSFLLKYLGTFTHSFFLLCFFVFIDFLHLFEKSPQKPQNE